MAGEQQAPIVHLVEDDQSAREATARFLRAAGHVVKTYSTVGEFLSASRGPGCIVLDVRLPGPSGLDLQDTLARSEDPLPVVFLTGHGDVPDSVRAMKSGAVDFLSKAVDGDVLLEAVARALAKDDEDRRIRARRRELQKRYDRLTPRERHVFAHLISGQLNKQVGYDLGISERTIKIHKYRVMAKMEADSLVDLVRIATDIGIAPSGKVR